MDLQLAWTSCHVRIGRTRRAGPRQESKLGIAVPQDGLPWVTTKMSSQSVVPIAVAIEEQSRHPKTQRFLGSGSSSGHKVFPTARFPRGPRRGHRTLFARQLLFPRFGAWRRRRSWATQGQRQRRQNFAATKTRTGLVVAIPQQVPGHENTSGVSLGTRTPQKNRS